MPIVTEHKNCKAPLCRQGVAPNHDGNDSHFGCNDPSDSSKSFEYILDRTPAKEDTAEFADWLYNNRHKWTLEDSVAWWQDKGYRAIWMRKLS